MHGRHTITTTGPITDDEFRAAVDTHINQWRRNHGAAIDLTDQPAALEHAAG